MSVVAGWPFLLDRPRASQAFHPDPGADQAADLLVTDERVQHERQNLVDLLLAWPNRAGPREARATREC